MELITIVDEEDNVIGFKDRESITSSDIYRSTGLWVTSPEGKILLAKRSLEKKKHPGLWGPAVAGTVEHGETYESNIVKEAEEELGLVGITPKFWFKKKVNGTHQRLSAWFTAVVEEDVVLRLNQIEVAETKWVTKEDLVQDANEHPEKYIESFRNWVLDYFKNEKNHAS